MCECDACVVRIVERVDRGVSWVDVVVDGSDPSMELLDVDEYDEMLLRSLRFLLLYLFGDRDLDAMDGLQLCGFPFRRGVLDVECELGRLAT